VALVLLVEAALSVSSGPGQHRPVLRQETRL
jgi:hypothetical protein